MVRGWVRWFVLLAALGLVAAGCGRDAGQQGSFVEREQVDDNEVGGDGTPTEGEGEGEGEAIQVGLVYDIGGRGDKSFNDAAAAGLDQAAQEFDIESRDLSPSAGGENREELLRLLAEQGYELIFGIGFAFSEGVAAVAEEQTETSFAIVDAVVELPNVASLVFAEEQGSFLVGAAAALTSKTGKIGFIGGVEVDLIKKFEAGYIAGAKHVNPDIEVETKYITQPPDFGGFNDPAKGKEIALGMYGGGADVVYHAAGGSGAGLFDAAKEASSGGDKKWAIGVDSDQYQIVDPSLQPFILTSMIKKVDVAVYETIKALAEGNFEAGVQVFDLEAGGVGYSTSGGHIDAITDQLEQLRQEIIDGDITVPTTP